MNDSINIKIGAEDTGFESALKTVQAELSRLEGKVQAGDMTFKELDKTMKEIGKVQALEARLKAIGDASGQSSPKVDALGNDIKAAGDKSEKMGDQSGIGFGKLAAAVGVGQIAAKAFTAALDAAFSAVQGTVDGFKAALDLGGTLTDLSASTGESAGNLLLLQQAFDNTGIGAEKVGPSIAKLQDKINSANEGSAEAAIAFGRMGISLEELAGKTPTEQLALVASGITSIEDPSKRAATAIDIFGKSGAELLPLLTNFSGEMTEAGATVGSMADIMNSRASIFDAIGDRFKIIQNKVRDFAAGILDKALPAIDAITSALSRIDAAAVGQKLANAFLGGEKAMKGFQAAVDAISVGKVGLAFQVFWESLKLQSMQTADAIYKNLVAGFKTASDFISQIFRSDSPAISLIKTTFGLVGSYISEKLYTALSDFMESIGRMGMAEKFRYQAETSATEVQRALDTIPAYAGIIAQDAGDALGKTPEQFKANLASIPPLFDGITDQQAKVAELEKQVTAATAATSAEREKQVAQTAEELKKREEIRAQADALAAAEKAAKTKIISLETAINEAKAAGNEAGAQALEKELENLKAKQEIAKLTEEYQKNLGVNADEAERLARNFVNAKNAANSLADRNVVVTVTTKVNRQEYDDLMASINAGVKDKKTIEILTKITGVDANSDWNKAYQTLQNMQSINKNFDVALKVSGADSLQELWQNLNSIPTTKQIQLGMQITGKDTYDQVVQSLPDFAGTKTAKLILEQAGFENMTQFIDTLKGVPDEKRTKVILEALGVPDLAAAQAALDQVLINDGKKATVKVVADPVEAEQTLASVRASASTPITLTTLADVSSAISDIDKVKQTALQPLTLNLQGDASDVSAKVNAFSGMPISFSLQADDTAAAQKINALGADPISLSLQADTADAEKKIKKLSGPIDVKINSGQVKAAVASMQAQIQNSFTGGTGGPGGDGGAGGQGGQGGDAYADVTTIQATLTSTIASILSQIRDRLPQYALVP